MSWKSNKQKALSVKPSGTPPNPSPVRPLNASTHGTARQLAPKADTAESEFDAGNNGGGLAVPQSTAGKDDAVSSEGVDVPNDHGGPDHPASTEDFSPGKNHVGLRDGEVPSVLTYAERIGESWRRWIEGILEVAHHCAEASARLTTAQKSELMLSLPFDEATFSKLVQIGNDARLQKPEIRRLLPPHYTKIYAITVLNDEELGQAIAEKIIHLDMKRADLEAWRDSRREQPDLGDTSNPQEAATDSGVATPPIAPTQDPIESGVGSSTPSQHEIRDKPAVEDGLPADLERADKESDQPAVKAGDDQSIVPDADADKSARPDDHERMFERFTARWKKYLATDWGAMPKETQARFIAEVLGYAERVK
jgi:hypothetical protein